MKSFWKALALFAYRRWRRHEGAYTKAPTGIPGHRDPDYPCNGYNPSARFRLDWRCDGDGHYLCEGCAHWRGRDADDDTDADAAKGAGR